jgi:HD-like signal output (HDOD) protein
MKPTLLHEDIAARLPSPQGVAFALNQVCRSDSVNLQEIADLVRSDPALSGRLLALANSAAMGGRSIVAVDDAIARIGVSSVAQVALAFSLIDHYSTGACLNFNYAGFWSQSLLMAAAVQEFGTVRRLGVAGELFTLGLLSQIGCLAMATAFPKEYSDLIVSEMDRAEMVAQENILVGTNHLALSQRLMTDWGMPIETVSPFCRYEMPNPCSSDMTRFQNDRAQLASTAWHIALAIAQESVGAVLERNECVESLDWMGLDIDTLNEILREIESTWRFWLTLISRR